MPRDSIGRRVARAASIGGGKSYRSRTPWGWYSVLLAVCVVGLGLVIFSRHQLLQQKAAGPTTTTTQPPTAAPTIRDHWQVALSVDVCGKVVNLPASTNLKSGLTTPGNGVVNVQPANAGKDAPQYVGSNSTIGKFLSSEGVELTTTSLTIPSSVKAIAGTYNNGDKCGSAKGQAQLFIWATPTTPSPFPVTAGARGITYTNGALYLVAFVPKGAKVPTPLAKSLVAAFLQTTQTTLPTTPTTVPGTTTTTTTAPGTTTTTTTTGGGSTTAGSGTTTQPG